MVRLCSVAKIKQPGGGDNGGVKEKAPDACLGLSFQTGRGTFKPSVRPVPVRAPVVALVELALVALPVQLARRLGGLPGCFVVRRGYSGLR